MRGGGGGDGEGGRGPSAPSLNIRLMSINDKLDLHISVPAAVSCTKTEMTTVEYFRMFCFLKNIDLRYNLAFSLSKT